MLKRCLFTTFVFLIVIFVAIATLRFLNRYEGDTPEQGFMTPKEQPQ